MARGLGVNLELRGAWKGLGPRGGRKRGPRGRLYAWTQTGRRLGSLSAPLFGAAQEALALVRIQLPHALA